MDFRAGHRIREQAPAAGQPVVFDHGFGSAPSMCSQAFV